MDNIIESARRLASLNKEQLALVDEEVITDILKYFAPIMSDSYAPNGEWCHLCYGILLKRISQNALVDILKLSGHWKFAEKIAPLINDKAVFEDILLHCDNSTARCEATEYIDNQDLLLQAVKNDKSQNVGICAIRRLNDIDALLDIAKNKKNILCESAIIKLVEMGVKLDDVATSAKSSKARIRAIHHINDQKLLIEIAQTDKDDAVRLNALEKIDDKAVVSKVLQNLGSDLPENERYLKFDNFNFKLAIVNELMYNQGILCPKYKAKFKSEDGYELLPAVVEFFEELKIPKFFASCIEKLSPEAPDRIYRELYPYWDGEDDIFYIKDISEEELKQFPKLKELETEDTLFELSKATKIVLRKCKIKVR